MRDEKCKGRGWTFEPLKWPHLACRRVCTTHTQTPTVQLHYEVYLAKIICLNACRLNPNCSSFIHVLLQIAYNVLSILIYWSFHSFFWFDPLSIHQMLSYNSDSREDNISSVCLCFCSASRSTGLSVQSHKPSLRLSLMSSLTRWS